MCIHLMLSLWKNKTKKSLALKKVKGDDSFILEDLLMKPTHFGDT